MAVEKVSKEEIKKAYASKNANISSTANSSANFSVEKNAEFPTNNFIKKLSVDDVKNFFKDYGVVTVCKYPENAETKFIFVACDCFELTFNDFECVFRPLTNQKTDGNGFVNTQMFLFACEDNNIEPDKAMENIIALNFLGRKFSQKYSNARSNWAEHTKKVSIQNRNKLMAQIPPIPSKVKSDLEVIENMKEAETKNVSNWLTYGGDIKEYYETIMSNNINND